MKIENPRFHRKPNSRTVYASIAFPLVFAAGVGAAGWISKNKASPSNAGSSVSRNINPDQTEERVDINAENFFYDTLEFMKNSKNQELVAASITLENYRVLSENLGRIGVSSVSAEEAQKLIWPTDLACDEKTFKGHQVLDCTLLLNKEYMRKHAFTREELAVYLAQKVKTAHGLTDGFNNTPEEQKSDFLASISRTALDLDLQSWYSFGQSVIPQLKSSGLLKSTRFDQLVKSVQNSSFNEWRINSLQTDIPVIARPQ